MSKITMKIEDGYIILNHLNDDYKIDLKILASYDWISKTDIEDFIALVHKATNINVLE